MKPIYLLVTSYFPFPGREWNCAFSYDFVKAVEKTGRYRVVVVNTFYAHNYQVWGVDVIGFRTRISGRWIAPRLFDFINIYRFRKALKGAGINLKDVVVAHGHLVPSAVYLAHIKRHFNRIVTLLHFHDPDPFGMELGAGSPFKRRRYYRYHASLLKHVDAYVSISENVSRVAREAPHQTVFNTYPPMQQAMRDLAREKPMPRKPILLLHNGVNLEIFSKEGHKPKDANFVIGCVGVYRDWKDQMTLLRAVELLVGKIPNLKVRMVGTPLYGTFFEDCQRFAKEKNLPVEFVLSIPHEKLQDFYHSLDLFVLPSNYEGFGCVFTEAHACGTPFITCKGQGMDDYVTGGDRDVWLCNERDPEDLAAKILHYYEKRPQQRLAAETDIDVLIPKFLDEVEHM